jgi:hypothetical protein
MADGGIYLLRDDDRLVEMREQPYDSEDMLQALLEKHPSLLAGDQVKGVASRRWLLVAREASLPAEPEAGGRWSVDHLFLDQDAVPTLVEVKRSTDTRIRREVVGQMLDYAANAVVYWPIERLRAEFEASREARGDDPDQIVREHIADDRAVEDFWGQANTNLRAGRIRLVFVADELPQELQRIIEFLNVQMSPAEVIGIEVRQYVGEGLKTLVPRVLGQTAEAQQRKGAGPTRPPREYGWPDYSEKYPEDRVAVARVLFDGMSRYVEEENLPWTAVFNSWYIAFQRPGGYNVAVIHLRVETPDEFGVKLPTPPDQLGLENPYPNLNTWWADSWRQWMWAVPNATAVPDVRRAAEISRGYQPPSGAMKSA